MPESFPNYKLIGTYRILEATDPAEWNALNASNKSIYALLISAGTVNFAEGTRVRSILLGMFPTGNTNAKLILL
jgi:hypothetical protein